MAQLGSEDGFIKVRTCFGALAQLARASRWQREGHRFESDMFHQTLVPFGVLDYCEHLFKRKEHPVPMVSAPEGETSFSFLHVNKLFTFNFIGM